MHTVHPHTHGELACPMFQSRSSHGSSPYTRGTRFKFVLFTRFLWFIPIHTGNSSLYHNQTSGNPVHPHTHGELQVSCRLYKDIRGSSPYTRGTHVAFPDASSVHRFIPIHTGNSFHQMYLSYIASVHPHTHGEL
ncbi:conserved hypothetical protein [Methanospirillum hungatei JF-1]|nr:conserved hypothetical protein [Methanospirillum hungatei JF-1]